MIGYPVTDEELDVVERAAEAVIEAVGVKDYDTAYIVAKTAHDPAMVAMFVAEIAGQS